MSSKLYPDIEEQKDILGGMTAEFTKDSAYAMSFRLIAGLGEKCSPSAE